MRDLPRRPDGIPVHIPVHIFAGRSADTEDSTASQPLGSDKPASALLLQGDR
jgi:hypothetical protein